VSSRERQLRHLAQSKPKFREDIPDNDSGRDGDIVYVKRNNITESYIKEDGEWINLFTGTDVQRTAQQGGSRVRVIGGMSVSVPSGGSGNHNLLLNLDDDDHPHYVHNIAARTITANHTFSGNPIFSGNASFTGQPTFSNIDINGGDIASTVVINKSPEVSFNSGDVQGSLVLSNLGNATGSLTIQADAVESSMIADNAVTLTTQTTGNYMVNVTGNSQVSVNHSQGEGSTASLSIVSNSIGNTQLEYNTGQHLTTSSNVQFGNISGSAITGITLNTGHGANELYPMNQAVRTTDNVQFGDIVVSGDDISSDPYSSGFAGSGWKIDNTSTAEFKDLILRGTLTVYELLIQQVRATNGNVFITSSAKVESSNSLSAINDDGTITFEEPQNNLCPFVANDIIMMQQVKPGAAASGANIIKKLVYKVSSVSNNVATVTNIGYNNSSFPEAGDEFVRIGNTSVATRQGSIYLTSDDSNAPFIDIKDGIASYNDWNDATKTKVRVGKLDGITDTDAGLNGSQSDLYGLYGEDVYLKGHIYATSGEIGGISINSGTLTITASDISDVDSYATNQDKQKLTDLLNDSPSGSGFFLDANRLGYYANGAFKTYMDRNGDFALISTGAGNNTLTWDSSTGVLNITGDITVSNPGDFAPTDAEANDSAQDNPTTYSFGGSGGFTLTTNGTPSTGLNITSEFMGYYNNGWKTMMKNNGDFFLGGTTGSLVWTHASNTLAIKGSLTAEQDAQNKVEILPNDSSNATLTVKRNNVDIFEVGSSTQAFEYDDFIVANSAPVWNGGTGNLSAATDVVYAKRLWSEDQITNNIIANRFFKVDSTDATKTNFYTKIVDNNLQAQAVNSTPITSVFSLNKSYSNNFGTDKYIKQSMLFDTQIDSATGASNIRFTDNSGAGTSIYQFQTIVKDTLSGDNYADGALCLMGLDVDVSNLNSLDRDDFVFIQAKNGSTKKFQVQHDGDVVSAGNITAFGASGNFLNVSDIRLKKDIERLKNSSELVMQLKPSTYKWKEDNLEDVGFIAQEVEEVLPNVVHVTPGFIGDDEKVKTVSYIKIIPYLVDTIQELTKRIEELEK
jgi:hypothetical protein